MILNFNISFLFIFFDCMHIEIFVSQAKLQVGRPKSHHNSNLDITKSTNCTLRPAKPFTLKGGEQGVYLWGKAMKAPAL